MKLGLQLGYWSAQPPTNHAELVAAAEEAGFDTMFTAEAWGSDAFTRWRGGAGDHANAAGHLRGSAVGAHPDRVRHGVVDAGPPVRRAAHPRPRRLRTPGGGGLVRPAFPQAAGPHREYIDVVRQVWARRGPVTSAGPHYPPAAEREGTTGLGKALKPIVHPLRADIPIMLGAEGPKNVALAAEICDGWLPIFYSPRLADMYNEWLDEGFARPGAPQSGRLRDLRHRSGGDHRRPPRHLRDDQPFLALYMGGMGFGGHQFPRRGLLADGLRRGGRGRHEAVPLRS